MCLRFHAAANCHAPDDPDRRQSFHLEETCVGPVEDAVLVVRRIDAVLLVVVGKIDPCSRVLPDDPPDNGQFLFRNVRPDDAGLRLLRYADLKTVRTPELEAEAVSCPAEISRGIPVEIAVDRFCAVVDRAEPEGALRQVELLQRPGGNKEIIRGKSPIPAMKAIKNEAEIAGFRQAMLHDGIAMVKFLKWLDDQFSTLNLQPSTFNLPKESTPSSRIGITVSGWAPEATDCL